MSANECCNKKEATHEILFLGILVLFVYLMLDDLRFEFRENMSESTLRSPFILPFVVLALAYVTTKNLFGSLLVSLVYVGIMTILKKLKQRRDSQSENGDQSSSVILSENKNGTDSL